MAKRNGDKPKITTTQPSQKITKGFDNPSYHLPDSAKKTGWTGRS